MDDGHVILHDCVLYQMETRCFTRFNIVYLHMYVGDAR